MKSAPNYIQLLSDTDDPRHRLRILQLHDREQRHVLDGIPLALFRGAFWWTMTHEGIADASVALIRRLKRKDKGTERLRVVVDIVYTQPQFRSKGLGKELAVSGWMPWARMCGHTHWSAVMETERAAKFQELLGATVSRSTFKDGTPCWRALGQL